MTAPTLVRTDGRSVWQAKSGQWWASCPCGWVCAGCEDEYDAHGAIGEHVDEIGGCSWKLRLYGKARREERKREAAERRALRAALTPDQQLGRLDTLFGIGAGATRERRRLVMSR